MTKEEAHLHPAAVAATPGADQSRILRLQSALKHWGHNEHVGGADRIQLGLANGQDM
jgi:hypothetical protein